MSDKIKCLRPRKLKEQQSLRKNKKKDKFSVNTESNFVSVWPRHKKSKKAR